MKAEIISIGDEILIGQVVNTNAAFIAEKLHEEGIEVIGIEVVPDTSGAITEALDRAVKRAGAVIMTGGLGPTKDDITKKSLADFFGVGMVTHEPSLEHIRKLFRNRSRKLQQVHIDQALVPENAEVFNNGFGTAPGLWFEHQGVVIVSLPGVPYEMEALMDHAVIPKLLERDDSLYTYHKTVLTAGVGESWLAEMIAGWEEDLPEHFKLAYLPQPGIVRLRITARGNNRGQLRKDVEEQISLLNDIIPDLIFGYDHTTLEEAVGKLLREKGATLATAESCTGGYLAHLVTSVPGSSDYYNGSVVSYSNEVKERQLGVGPGVLEKKGAVSKEVALAMAEGVRKQIGTDYALSTTGIAGPDGGTSEKPIGTVWIGLATPEKTIAKKFTFGDNRFRNIRRSALAALDMLRGELEGIGRVGV